MAVPPCLPLEGGGGGEKFGWMAFWGLNQSLSISSTEVFATWGSHLGEAYVTSGSAGLGRGVGGRGAARAPVSIGPRHFALQLKTIIKN